MATTEIEEPQTPYECLELWEHHPEGPALFAGLGFYALALESSDRDEAEAHFERGLAAIKSVDESSSPTSEIPNQPGIFARACVNFAPITRELVVSKALSEPDVVQEVSVSFIRDLAIQARSAEQLVRGKDPKDKALAAKKVEVISALDSMAPIGLLMRFQTDMMISSDWMVHPPLLEMDNILPGDENPIRQLLGASVYSGPSKTDFSLVYKIYTRWSRYSSHSKSLDPDTSVIRIKDDLALPDDKLEATELEIIYELADRKGKRRKIHARIDSLLDRLDEQTAQSLGLSS